MQTPLFLRGHDSVAEFEASSSRRYQEAERLRRNSFTLGAIYLYGYSVEMLVKAAFFRNAGFTAAQLISDADRRNAIDMYTTLGLPVRPAQHDVAGWAQLAVAARQTTPNPYPRGLALEVVDHATSLYLIWRETLRYRSSDPTNREVATTKGIADWFQQNYRRM